jgi:hypothetical protein
MNRRTARGNRIGLAVVGAALLLAGAAALARGLDLLPDLLGSPDAPVTDQATRDVAADQPWFWPVLAVVLVVIALLGLRWLIVQTRTDALGTLRLEPDAGLGTTRLPARTVTGALSDDLGRSPYLRRVTATLTGNAARPHLHLAAAMAPTAEPGAVRERVHEALDRSRQALEEPQLPTTVHLRAGR